VKRYITKSVRIEEAIERDVVELTCRAKRGLFYTPLDYNRVGIGRVPLLKRMLESYGLSISKDGRVAPDQLVGLFFKLKIFRWKGHWLIDDFARCDSFPLVTEADRVASLEELCTAT
jgi:hypothetical protein